MLIMRFDSITSTEPCKDGSTTGLYRMSDLFLLQETEHNSIGALVQQNRNLLQMLHKSKASP
jgi:hypothetical protein